MIDTEYASSGTADAQLAHFVRLAAPWISPMLRVSWLQASGAHSRRDLRSFNKSAIFAGRSRGLVRTPFRAA